MTDEERKALSSALSAIGPLAEHQYDYGYGGETVDSFSDRSYDTLAIELSEALDREGWKLVRK